VWSITDHFADVSLENVDATYVHLQKSPACGATPHPKRVPPLNLLCALMFMENNKQNKTKKTHHMYFRLLLKNKTMLIELASATSPELYLPQSFKQ
jgi:hypothetical protein